MRRPVKNDGSAAGQRNFANTWARDAPYVRNSSLASPSTDANPSSSATVIGKNVTSTITSTFGSNPNPNHSTNSGASATIGIVWEPTMSGYSARRTVAD